VAEPHCSRSACSSVPAFWFAAALRRRHLERSL